MTSSRHIALIISATSVGGTEKATALLASGLLQRGHRVDCVTPSEGPWSRYAREAGVGLHVLPWTPADLAAWIRAAQPSILHQRVSGMALENPVYEALARLEADRRPPLIETNVFGRFEDPASEPWVAARMFISVTSLVQAFRRAHRRLDLEALRRFCVLPNPLPPPLASTAPERETLRRELGCAPDELLGLRLGRPDPRKWSDWGCRAFAKARCHHPNLRLLLMEPPEPLARAVREGRYGPGLLVRPATSDRAWLDRLYACGDFMLHASYFGESFGYTIAEAMAAGLPVIVRTTPFGDNAQVELVENGVTGWVCGSVGEMSRRLADLAADAPLRRRFGEAGRRRVEGLTVPSRTLDLFESLMERVLTGEESPLLARQREQVLAYAAGFRAREWTLSERPMSHPLDYAGARLYNLWRRTRSRARRGITSLTRR